MTTGKLTPEQMERFRQNLARRGQAARARMRAQPPMEAVIDAIRNYIAMGLDGMYIEDFEVYTGDDKRHIDLKAPATIRHEEHNEIGIEPGLYLVRREREYDYFRKHSRRILD